MKKILDYLQQLGFSEIEARLYLKLLESGQMSVAELALAININRTAAYAHIYSLLEKGIIAEIIIGSRKQLVATEPERLGYLIEKKQESLKAMQSKFPYILTAINSSFKKEKNERKEDIKYYKGRNGVKAIYEECLKVKELRSYYSASDIVNIFPENFKLFNDAFIHNPEIKMYEICEDSPESRKQIEFVYGKNVRYFWKLLPHNMKLTSNDILIYDDKVSIINIRDKNDIDGVVLSNRDYYNNSKQLFDLLWKML